MKATTAQAGLQRLQAFFWVALVFAMLSVPTGTTQAEPLTAFEQVFERIRGVKIPPADFSVSDPNASFTLTVDNGNAGQTAPTSGVILLNGVKIVTLSKKITRLVIPVDLQASNTLTVKLTSKHGRKVSVVIKRSRPVTVFGPTIFTQIKGVKKQSADFAVNDPNAPFLLVSDNAAENTLPLSGKILLNGVKVVTLSLSKKKLHQEFPLTLLSTNTLSVQLTGKAGKKVALSILRLENYPPVANAGADQTVRVGDDVTLNGSASTDRDGERLQYAWAIVSKPDGSSATLTGADSVLPTLHIDHPGTYQLQLIVNDGLQDSVPDTVILTTTNSAPVANAGPDQTPHVGDTILLDGSASDDVDGDNVTHSWLLTQKPAGSQTALNQANTATPGLYIDKSGHYNVELIVNDGQLNSEPDNVAIDTQNTRPVAHAGADQTATTGTQVTLDGSQSTDVDANALTYSWSLITLPSGSSATLSNPLGVQSIFTPDLPGSYIGQLIVNDGNLDSEPDTATIAVENVNPQPCTADQQQSAAHGNGRNYLHH